MNISVDLLRRVLVPFRSVAPGRDGMPATRRLAIAPAVRMIDRVHADAAITACGRANGFVPRCLTKY
jgi:hypothetical protein